MPNSDAAVIYKKIYSVIQQIPKGKVATYGQIARLAGIPRQARRVGYALGISSEHTKAIPWHRVINAKGEISSRWEQDAMERQKMLLRKEGVVLDKNVRVSLERFQWSEGR